MTRIEAPKHLSAAERKAFDKQAETLASAGVEVELRADLIADFVQLETRIKSLRKAEKTAESDKKLAASRALTTATVERRRLHEMLYRGARLAPRTRAEKVERLAVQPDAAGDIDPAHEAWRDYFWGRYRGCPEREGRDRDKIEKKHGPCGLAPLLFAFVEEQRGWHALMAACGGRPGAREIAELKERLPLRKFTNELLAPSAQRRED